MGCGRNFQGLELARTLRTDRFEFRLLLVGQRPIEIVKRRTYHLDRLQHGVEIFTDRSEPSRRRQRIAARHDAFSKSAALVVASCSVSRLARCVSVGRNLVDLGGRPFHHAGWRRAAALDQRALGIVGALLCR